MLSLWLNPLSFSLLTFYIESIILTTLPHLPCNTTTSSITFYIKDKPDLFLNATNDTIICSNQTITVDATAIGGIPGYSYLWDNGLGSGSSHNFTAPFGATKYVVAVTDTCGEIVKDSLIINVNPAPVAAFTFNPQPATLLDPVIVFKDQSTGLPISWLWNFDDPQNEVNSILQNPNHIYSDSGTFCVKLIISNSFSCIDSTTNCVRIDPQFAFYVPKAFSPNDDGLNDGFSPKGDFIKEYELVVMNRWGNVVFKTTDINDKWNGKVKNAGKTTEEETYVYVIKVTDIFDKEHKYIGHITLLR